MKRTLQLLLFAIVGCVIITSGSAQVWCKRTVNGVTYYDSTELDQAIADIMRSYDDGNNPLAQSGETQESSSVQQIPKQEKKQAPAPCVHEYSSEVIVEATCAQPGTMKYTCSKCKNSYTEELPLTEHIFKTEITREATCNTTGEERTVCTVCGEESVTEIPATGHTESDWQITKPNGLFTEGKQIKVCTVCNEQLDEQIIASTYPITYLYVGIGAGVALLVLAGLMIAKKKKSNESTMSKAA